MPTAIEVSAATIRLCRYEQGRITELESFPLPAEADPIAALQAAPLPRSLGEVRLAINHPDLLLRTLVQPPVPLDRLDRVVRFEVQGLAQGGDRLMSSWHLGEFGGGGHMRIVALIAKQQVVEDLQRALQAHGGRLVGLTLPGIATWHAWRHQLPADSSTCAIVDVGSATLGMTFVRDGDLAFCRSQSPAIGQLIEDVAELRGIKQDDAREMLAKLGTNPPQDIKDLIGRQGSAIGTAVGNAQRFAKAQLQFEELELHAIYLTGAGARVGGLAAAIEERAKVPVRILNPFAGQVLTVGEEVLDRQALLPGPWTATIGLTTPGPLLLDVMDQARAERRAYWQTSGALRLAAAACVALLALALVVQELRGSSTANAVAELQGESDDGLVPTASAELERAAALDAERAALAQRTRALAASRDAGRSAVEFLNLLASLQDPSEHPVYIRRFGVQPSATAAIQVELEGFAEDARTSSKAEVLNSFRARLEEAYREGEVAIVKISDLKVPVLAQRQPFHWVIELATGNQLDEASTTER